MSSPRFTHDVVVTSRDRAIDLFRQGVLSQSTYERLAADIDTRLLDLESASSGDADGGPGDSDLPARHANHPDSPPAHPAAKE